MGAAVDRVLHKLTGVKPIAGGTGVANWVARCPAHDDVHQSLQISERSDCSVGLHCHAGCSKTTLLASLGLDFSDLFLPKDDHKVIASTYDYRGLDGKVLYQSVRFVPKEFRMRRPTAGGWSWNMGPLKGKHIPYRLNELKGQTEVAIVEGEKDADRLWSVGIPATTNIGGAGKWTSGESKGLKQAGVHRAVIIPDNDEAGKSHAAKVAELVHKVNIATAVIELPHLDLHGDVSDWLNNGGTPALLKELMLPAPPAVTVVGSPQTHTVTLGGLDIRDYHLTDLGAAEAFRDRFGDRLRFDHQRKRWLLWDGHFWRPDQDDAAYRLADEHVRLLQQEALQVPDFLEKRKCTEFALTREKRPAVQAMMGTAQHLTPFALAGEHWDMDGWLLGCPNGVVDLHDGSLRSGSRDDFITLQAGAAYDPAALCPRWLQFLDEVFEGNQLLITYVHRAIGYSLTAEMREQVFFVAYGDGANGKSILLDTLEVVFGTYGHRADMRMFAGGGGDHSFQNADFRGKRLIFAAEVQPNSRMNEHVLKHFTGGETLRAEYKYGRSFTIRPVGKIWLGVNHRPKVADDSLGFWRRVRMIPFERTFTGTADDRQLRQTLRAEAPGILAWAVQGCLQWVQGGLNYPAPVREATEDYQLEEDPFQNFMTARVVADPTGVETFVALYTAYNAWAERLRIPRADRATAHRLGAYLKRKFITKDSGGQRRYGGLRLLHETLPDLVDQMATENAE